MSVLVIMEQGSGEWNKMSFETLAAGQQIARELGMPCQAAVASSDAAALPIETASSAAAVAAKRQWRRMNLSPGA